MMTFTEAAVHVLRLVGKPLHYKEITDVAIEKDLLSHVGKSPEVTMGARLAAVVKKGGKDNQLSRVKPGVFALAEWSQETVDKGLVDRTPALERLLQAEKAEAERAAEEGQASVAPPSSETSTVNLPVPSPEDSPEVLGDDEKARAQLSAAASALFEPEEDDDEPILGPGAEEDDDDEDDDPRKRRRGRRRGRGRDRDDDGLPSYTVSDAPEEVLAEVVAEARERGERNRDDGEREERERPRRERVDRNDDDDRERSRRERVGRNDDHDRERPRRERVDRNDDDDRERSRRERVDRNDDHDRDDRSRRDKPEKSDDDDIVQVIEQCLQGFRRSGSVPLKQLTDAVTRRMGRQNEPQAAAWVAAALRADNLRRQAAHERLRFRLLSNSRVALAEWSLDRDLLQAEKHARSEADRVRQITRKQLLRRLNELPQKAASEVWLLLLEKLGYTRFRTVRRHNSHSQELHLACVLESAGGELPTAVVIRRDGRDLGRERVTELRGGLHHYGAAALGLLVTTGQVMSGAKEEASAPFATPIHFLDGARVAELCELHGIGVVHQYVALPAIDTDWFDAIRSGQ